MGSGSTDRRQDVKFSAYDGDLEDTLDAMESAGFAKAIVVNLFLDARV